MMKNQKIIGNQFNLGLYLLPFLKPSICDSDSHLGFCLSLGQGISWMSVWSVIDGQNETLRFRFGQQLGPATVKPTTISRLVYFFVSQFFFLWFLVSYRASFEKNFLKSTYFRRKFLTFSIQSSTRVFENYQPN